MFTRPGITCTLHMVPIGPLPLRIVPMDFPTWAAWPSAGCIATSLRRNTGNLGIAVSAPQPATNSLGKRVKKLGSKSQFSSSFNISQVMLLKSKHGYPMLLDFWLKTPWNIHSTVLRRWHRSLSSGRELWGLKKGVFNVGFVQKSKPNANHGAGKIYIYI